MRSCVISSIKTEKNLKEGLNKSRVRLNLHKPLLKKIEYL